MAIIETVVMHVKKEVNSFVVIPVQHLFIFNASNAIFIELIFFGITLTWLELHHSDPPLEEADLPKGLWNCHSCRVKKVLKDMRKFIKFLKILQFVFKAQDAADPSGQYVDVDDEGDSDSSKNGKRPYNLLSSTTMQSGFGGAPERISSRRRTNNSDEVDVENLGGGSEKSSDKEEGVDSFGKVSFFGPLIKVAASMNPQQFELPPELVEPISFPGMNCNHIQNLGV